MLPGSFLFRILYSAHIIYITASTCRVHTRCHTLQESINKVQYFRTVGRLQTLFGAPRARRNPSSIERGSSRWVRESSTRRATAGLFCPAPVPRLQIWAPHGFVQFLFTLVGRTGWRLGAFYPTLPHFYPDAWASARALVRSRLGVCPTSRVAGGKENLAPSPAVGGRKVAPSSAAARASSAPGRAAPRRGRVLPLGRPPFSPGGRGFMPFLVTCGECRARSVLPHGRL